MNSSASFPVSLSRARVRAGVSGNDFEPFTTVHGGGTANVPRPPLTAPSKNDAQPSLKSSGPPRNPEPEFHCLRFEVAADLLRPGRAFIRIQWPAPRSRTSAFHQAGDRLFHRQPVSSGHGARLCLSYTDTDTLRELLNQNDLERRCGLSTRDQQGSHERAAL
jgi:hypothetical protein